MKPTVASKELDPAQATPRTLLRAIKNGMWIAARSNRPMPQEIQRHVEDFWNQAMAVLMIEGHEDAVVRLQEIIAAKAKDDRDAA